MAAQPYPGLRPFYRHEADIFFGREEHTDELLNKLATARFLAVVGTSGCGKSSLVRAGMIAALETGFMANAGPRWRFAAMRPGIHPMRRLAEALVDDAALGANIDKDVDTEDFILATLRRGPLGLVEVLQESPLPENTNLLVLVDQFEEIFRYRDEGDADEAEAFVSLLLETAEQRDLPIYVVITMRSDFIGDCALFTGLPEAMNQSQYLTPRLTRKQRQTAIVGPARVYGGDVEPDLTNHLLNEMGPDPGQLPLMQHLLMRMWTRTRTAVTGPDGDVGAGQDGLVLRMEDYELAGGVANALSRHADEAFNGLDSEQQQIAEALFRNLTERGTNRRDTRRPVTVQRVANLAGVTPEQIIDVAEAFRETESSFIVPAPPELLRADSILDISHESLIRQWKRLNQWVEDEAKSAETYRWLEQNARLWKAGDAALWGTPNLELALEWKSKQKPTHDWADRYGGDFDVAMEFLSSSEAHKKATAEARRIERRNRRLIWVVTPALILTTSLAAMTFYQANRAQKAEQEARVSELTAKAMTAVLRQDPERGILLALEAAAKDKEQASLEVQNALRIALSRTRLRGSLVGHEADLIDVEFSPDGSRIGTTSHDGTAKIWSTDTGTELATLTGHADSVWSIAFSPDGARIVTGSSDYTAKVWDAENGKEIESLSGHGDAVGAVAFSPDGKWIATGSTDETVIIWDAKTYDPVHMVKGHSGAVTSIAFGPENKFFSSADSDGHVKLWDLLNWEEIWSIHAHSDMIRRVAFSPDGTLIATASNDYLAATWDVTTGQYVQVYRGSRAAVSGVGFVANGQRLVTSTHDREIALWNVDNGQQLDLFRGHPEGEAITDVATNPNGSYLVTASEDDTARIWDTTPSLELGIISSHSADTMALAYDTSRNRLVTSSMDGTAKLWDVETLEELRTFEGHVGGVYAVALSLDGSQLLTSGYDRTVRLWDTDSGTELRRYSGQEEALYDIQFSPNGNLIAGASSDKNAYIWDTESAELMFPLVGHEDVVFSLAFNAEGTRIAIGSRDGAASVWDPATGDLLYWIEDHDGGVMDVAFSPDGLTLATASHDQRVRLWDAKNGSLLRMLKGHTDTVWGLAFDPDGSRLASASADQTVKLWDPATGKELLSIAGHDDDVYDLVFVDSGHRLVTSSWDDTARIHALEFGELMHLARLRISRTFTESECAEYLRAPEGCPETLASHLLAGKSNILNGDVQAAILNYRKAQEMLPALDKESAESWVSRIAASNARDLARGGDIDSAVSLFEEAIALDSRVTFDPSEKATQIRISRLLTDGRRLYLQEKFTDTISILREVEELTATLDAQTLVMLGNSQLQLEMYGEAMGYFEDALELDPNVSTYVGAEAAVGLARVHLQQNELDSAEKLLLQARSSFQNYGYVIYHMGEVAAARENPEEAISLYREVRADDPYHATALNSIGAVYYDTQFQFDLAYEAFILATEAYPDDPNIVSNRAEAALATKHYDEAIALASEQLNSPRRQARQMTDSLSPLHFVMISALALQGKSTETREALGAFVAYYNEFSSMPPSGWSFTGSRQFLREVETDDRKRELLLDVIDVIEKRPRHLTMTRFEKYL